MFEILTLRAVTLSCCLWIFTWYFQIAASRHIMNEEEVKVSRKFSFFEDFWRRGNSRSLFWWEGLVRLFCSFSNWCCCHQKKRMENDSTHQSSLCDSIIALHHRLACMTCASTTKKRFVASFVSDPCHPLTHMTHNGDPNNLDQVWESGLWTNCSNCHLVLTTGK